MAPCMVFTRVCVAPCMACTHLGVCGPMHGMYPPGRVWPHAWHVPTWACVAPCMACTHLCVCGPMHGMCPPGRVWPHAWHVPTSSSSWNRVFRDRGAAASPVLTPGSCSQAEAMAARQQHQAYITVHQQASVCPPYISRHQCVITVHQQASVWHHRTSAGISVASPYISRNQCGITVHQQESVWNHRTSAGISRLGVSSPHISRQP